MDLTDIVSIFNEPCFDSYHGPHLDPRDRAFLALAPALRARLRDDPQRPLWLQRSVPLLGLDPRFAFPSAHAHHSNIFLETLDAADFYHASIFADPDPLSGLGGWGNPSADYAVQDGAFANFRLTYPYPHTLRRNYTLRPFINDGFEFHNIPDKMANLSFTPEAVKQLVEGFKGDYREFQKHFDIQQVRCFQN